MSRTSLAPEAPEFAASLCVYATDMGVVPGPSMGGSFIDAMGMPGAIWSGPVFAGSSPIVIRVKAAVVGAAAGVCTDKGMAKSNVAKPSRLEKSKSGKMRAGG